MLIMKDVSQIAGDLVKCQLDQLSAVYKEVLTRVLTWLLVTLVAIMLAVGGLGLILWGVHLRLSLVAGTAGSAVILGILMLFGAIILYLIARNLLKD
jgi:hypothetical protein